MPHRLEVRCGTRAITDLGSVVCDACGHRARAFIASADRKPKRHVWSSFLLHVPSHFLGAKARAEVLKRLDRLLK